MPKNRVIHANPTHLLFNSRNEAKHRCKKDGVEKEGKQWNATGVTKNVPQSQPDLLLCYLIASSFVKYPTKTNTQTNSKKSPSCYRMFNNFRRISWRFLLSFFHRFLWFSVFSNSTAMEEIWRWWPGYDIVWTARLIGTIHVTYHEWNAIKTRFWFPEIDDKATPPKKKMNERERWKTEKGKYVLRFFGSPDARQQTQCGKLVSHSKT